MDQKKFNDRGYKALFSHPGMVEDLIRSFVREDFVASIDFSTLRRAFDSFVTEEFRERETDIVWEVKYRGQPVYFYILIEFQSSVDTYMALRLLLYILLLYQDLLKQPGGRTQKLPPVFPIVLFNGKEKWDAPLSIEELIEPLTPALTRYIPSFSYFKIAENEFPGETLKALNSLTSHLFMLETGEVKKIGEVLESIKKLLSEGVDPVLVRSLGIWLRRFFEKKKIDVDIDIESMNGKEVRRMLEVKLQEFEEQAVMRGRVEGRMEGKVEGSAEGKQEAVLKVLRKKFNDIPGAVEERILAIHSAEKLDEILLAAMDMASIGEIEAILG